MAGQCSTIHILCTLCLFTFQWVFVLSEPASISADPGFKEIQLSWTEQESGPSGVYRIKYCENQIWGEHFCRRKVVRSGAEGGKYAFQLKGLKMDTEYIIYLIKHAKRDRSLRMRSKEDDLQILRREKLLVKTLGFSAKARDCGPTHTEVDVQTGPAFSGRISAEGSSHPSCSIQGTGGNVNSYTLNLDHKLCGTEVNGTAAWTYLVVQENLPILTHSTKRFVVLCKFGLPDVFTVKSGLSLPYSNNISPPTGVAVPDRGARQYTGVQDANDDDIITLDDYQDHEIAAFESKYDHIHGLRGRTPKNTLRENYALSGRAYEEQARSGKLSNLIASRKNIGEEGMFRKFIDADSLDDESVVPETAIVLVFSVVGSIVILAACGLLLLCRKKEDGEETDREQLRRTETLHRPRRRRESNA